MYLCVYVCVCGVYTCLQVCVYVCLYVRVHACVCVFHTNAYTQVLALLILSVFTIDSW